MLKKQIKTKGLSRELSIRQFIIVRGKGLKIFNGIDISQSMQAKVKMKDYQDCVDDVLPTEDGLSLFCLLNTQKSAEKGDNKFYSDLLFSFTLICCLGIIIHF